MLSYPYHHTRPRPRRNRKNSSIRNAIQEVFLPVHSLVQPIFILDPNISMQKQAISSMPGIYRHSMDSMLKEVQELMDLGLFNVILFPVVSEEKKDGYGSYSHSPKNFYLQAIVQIKEKFPQVNVITDVALDPYSSDGHDGILKDGIILNDETIDILVKMSIAQAKAGADIIGPSDMMDGRILKIREGLDKNGFQNVSIMSYTAKYASHFYSPFRDALGSAPKHGNKKTYQMSYKNKREALLEAQLDFLEGADFLMVKPALFYLDIIQSIKEKFPIPVAAYSVSGEYSMVKLAIQNGYCPQKGAIEEVLYSIRRAGADMIITYFAKEYAQMCQV